MQILVQKNATELHKCFCIFAAKIVQGECKASSLLECIAEPYYMMQIKNR